MLALSRVFLFNPANWDEWKRVLDDHAADLVVIALIMGVAIVVIRTVFARTLRAVLTRAALRRYGRSHMVGIERRADTVVSVLVWVLTGFIVFLGIVLILDEFHKNVSALVASAGVIGIAIGLASQQIIKDFINGTLILIEDQFSVGDVVDVAGVSGSVIDMNLRRTTLRDMDGAVHVIPNSLIQVTTNRTQGFSRINFNVSVAYDENIDHVIEIINDECRQFAEEFAADIMKTPEVLRVEALAENSVDIKVLGDVRPGEQWRLTGELRRRIKVRFDSEGIEIPFRYLTINTKPDGSPG